MVSLNKYANIIQNSQCEIYGLSTDEKPIDKIEGVPIGNGSVFVEMDTKKVFTFDRENRIWREF